MPQAKSQLSWNKRLSIFLLIVALFGLFQVHLDIQQVSENYRAGLPFSIVGGGSAVYAVYYPDIPSPGSSMVVSFELNQSLVGGGTNNSRMAPKNITFDYLEDDNRPRDLPYDYKDERYSFVYPGRQVIIHTEFGAFYVPKIGYTEAAYYFFTSSPFGLLILAAIALVGMYFWFNSPIKLGRLLAGKKSKKDH